MTDSDDKVCSTPTAICSAFSNQYSSVFTKDAGCSVATLPLHFVKSELKYVHFTHTNVFSRLCTLKRSSSTGNDRIPNVFLRDFANFLTIPLTSLFNVSFLSGKLPESWLCGTVIPIKKIPKPTAASHYRPISLTSSVVKLMEYIIRDRVLEHCLSNNILTDYQFGFLPKRSVDSQLVTFFDTCTKFLDDGVPVDVFYLDFAKAFDSISHTVLLLKLKSCGIAGPLLAFISAWLINRCQSVFCNGCTSQSVRLTSGVPQGSVLGPLLFTVYINDLPNSVQDASILMYADDSKCFRAIRSAADVDAFTLTINSILQWCKDNSLCLAVSKCHILHLGSNNHCFPYIVNGVHIDAPEFVRDLGVLVDSALTFQQHIYKQIHKAKVRLITISRSFRTKDTNFHLLLYRSFVRPLLEFSSVVWSPHTINLSTAIENVQRKFTKYLPNLFNVSYPDRLSRCGLVSLGRRRLLTDLLFIYKVCVGLVHVPCKLFTLNTRHHRGHQFCINHVHAAKLVRSEFIGLRVINQWNALPAEVVEAGSVADFKLHLNTYLDHIHMS